MLFGERLRPLINPYKRSGTYSRRTCARVPCGCLASRGRHGHFVATYRTGGRSGIGRDLPYLRLVLGASVVCLTHKFGFEIGVIVFSLGGIAAQLMLAAPATIVYAETAFSDTVRQERTSDRRSVDVGAAADLLRLRAPRQSPRLRTLRAALGAVWIVFGLC